MPWADQAASGKGLLNSNLTKRVDWDQLLKSVQKGALVDVNGTQISVSCANSGKKDDAGKMHDGNGYRLDIQSVANNYVNWQIQSGGQSIAGILTKCGTWYQWQTMVTQLIDSGRRGALRKDA